MMIQLQAKGIVFGYSSSTILKDVSFEIGPSRLVTIVGPNGSGKSTLIKCIDRILAPEKGSILIDRKEVTKMDRMEIARNLAYVPQSSARTFSSNVFDTVLMGRRPHIGWLSSSDDEERVWEVLRLLGIEELAMSGFGELSGGQQQKVLIARALVQDTKVMLLDEPTSNLDIWHQLDVMNIVRDLVKKRRMTALMALHDLNLASKYSDGIIMMKKGRIMAAGDPASVLTPENIETIYNVEVAVRSQSEDPFIVPIRQIRPNGSSPRPGGRFFSGGKRRSRLPRSLGEIKEIRLS
ncbi:MAG: ABC transporter ATP-binding protein [Methanothrix sp.]|jgi:iron complex transport system ATP-binding protein|nr:ABC transporter ATP-binding protein [Methanothrix sp.]OPX82761.1 MAG: Cobalamin import ATP-binding protein BtuD [Methanosaeta sp. PtaB.Bin087]OPY49067.1 MAG: Cobalamin import ATP-binding protein BtuD [Methanosaeta sp. PtaU1.Bin055]NLX38202.1 ABC transporter ATP-binding protein [Methanothrix sp.]HNR57951.1 ABC transporter ATP-binding protein [Methanothrix sp.]